MSDFSNGNTKRAQKCMISLNNEHLLIAKIEYEEDDRVL